MSSEGSSRSASSKLGHAGTPPAVGGGQKIDEPAQLLERLEIIGVGAIAKARFRRMNAGAAKLVGRDGLVGDRSDDLRAGDEKMARVLDHEDEIGQRRRKGLSAGARSHDQRNLRDDSGGADMALEDLAIAGERRDARLEARAA